MLFSFVVVWLNKVSALRNYNCVCGVTRDLKKEIIVASSFSFLFLIHNFYFNMIFHEIYTYVHAENISGILLLVSFNSSSAPFFRLFARQENV